MDNSGLGLPGGRFRSDGSQQRLRGVRTVSRRCCTAGSRRTLKIITLASVAYFVCWSPYSALTFAQSFASWLRPPSAVDFAVIWLANANSAVNVFIYSYTNAQFRRQCVLLVSRLCCSRLSRWSSNHDSTESRDGHSFRIDPSRSHNFCLATNILVCVLLLV